MILLLIRHAEYDGVNVMLTGRQPGHGLNALGRQHARELSEAVAPFRAQVLMASPVQRTMETAAFLAEMWGIPVLENPSFIELNYGEWTGRSVESMHGDPVWEKWNRHRSAARIAGGESMVEVLDRTARELQRLADTYPHQRVAIVSHGDIIKAAVAPLLGIPADKIPLIKMEPVSISILTSDPSGKLQVLVKNLERAKFLEFCAEHRLLQGVEPR
jgi:probable phosphoglycerate mutase